MEIMFISIKEIVQSKEDIKKL